LSGSLFFQFFQTLKKKIIYIKAILCNFSMGMLKYIFQICPQKVEKTTLKSCSEKLKSTFFPLLPAQPKWPKQKNVPKCGL
jgi:hypothetical protein